jgi:hypothetical protein
MTRRLTSWILLGALSLELVSCMGRKRVGVSAGQLTNKDRETIVAVTTNDGREIHFVPPGATVRGDVVSGQVPGSTPFEIREDQVSAIHQRQDGSQSRVESLSTRDGRQIRFQPPGGIRKGGSISGLIDEPLEIPATDVQRYWVEHESFSALKSLGLVVALFAGVVVAIAATKESCPFVYSWDGTQYVFDAEPYGGATTRGLERDDYGELEHLKAVDGRYRLMVTNEVNESQYTNLMELWVVDHAPGLKVAADEWGGLHSLTGARPPTAAVDGEGHDLSGWLDKTDRLIWEPDAVPDARGELRREVLLEFDKPAGSQRMKLVAVAATGLWGSHMIREMLALRGRELEAWYAAVDGHREQADAVLAWNLREELYVLKVEVEEPTGWQIRGLLPGGGPLIAEQRVVALDVSRVMGNRVRIRLRPPAGFWALNSFAADWSPDLPLEMRVVHPGEARDSNGNDHLPELLTSDDHYYAMPETGARGYLTFLVPPSISGTERTVLLHTRGYYRLHLPAEGEPQREALRELTETPGSAARLAARRYAEWRATRTAER